ncbi:MAG TPA: MFS transporter [Natronosporangium sp.]|nr:MFS transporter [Natronosporangium sp.]
MTAGYTLRATAITVVCVMPVFLVGGLAVQIGEELAFSPAGLGLAVAAYFAVSALTSVPAGVVVERYGARTGARAGILLAAACLLGIAVAARGYPALVLLLAAGAAANGLGQLAANATLAAVPAHRQGLSFGIKQAAIPTATLLAGASVPAVALTIGWRWAFAAAAAAALATLALTPAAPAQTTGVRAGPARTAPQRATGALVVVGVAVALAAASAGSLGTFLVDSAASRGVAPGVAGLTLTLGSTVCIASRVGAGALVDRRRQRGDVGIVAVLLLTGAVGLALLAAPGTVALIIGVLLGFGFGWVFPGLVNVAVVQLHPHAPAAATSITQTGVYAGGSVGPLAFGAAAATAGYPVAWLAAATGMLLAAGLMLLGRRLLHAHRAQLAAPATR